MRTFKNLFDQKVTKGPLTDLFRTECHVCRYTVKIFEKLEDQGPGLDELARTLGVGKQALLDLRAADYCDPELVVRLCRFLELPTPPDCPRSASS